ncbi:putative inner dynein arm light chain axonemal [Drosophila madeirensis]|uniref:Inner dynein arm light chain axonemal n=2 Tax=obscura subgroup TaxID=32357 RepID=A0AAU9F0N5_DROMD|nr:putative inner dynein arm light chain, axonemal [Drosophila obscura]XP_034132533.1 putative inner dynein arm light chain, axonemal [Drosophila guanche]XP_034663055.1 putative inner dynein arm light chain, axonemal [Drosophila subobscura]SPP83643.1 blast:Putative inner dynein arm light chain%2C axonemal [Drosophila guanche]
MDELEITSVGQFQTLVRYNNPVLVVKHPEKKGAPLTELEMKRPQTAGALLDTKRETEEILNSILPPRCWEEDGQLWQQSVSSTPATRQDVINLQEMLDTRLQQTQARETGICPVRRELYSQCFDEIIRQVTINCSERGLLLLRIRDEIAMSMEAYETLYCSSVAFGMRKALQAHEEKEMLRDRVKTLELDKEALEEIIADMKLKQEQAERRNAELRASEEKKFTEEITFLKKTNAQLKAQLEGITAPKK